MRVTKKIGENVAGKRVFITGATSGIGKACAQLFAAAGCEVIGVARHVPAKEKETVRGGSIRYIKMDVTKPEDIEAVFRDMPRIDIAVLCAGMGVAGAIAEMPMTLVREQMEVNFFGVVGVCDKVLCNMHKAGGGSIVIIGSVAGKVAIPMQGYYSASKYALEAYADALRIEEKCNNIRVSIVEPGDTKTGFTKNRKIYTCEGSEYEERVNRAVGKMERDEQNGSPAKNVAKLVFRVAGMQNPPPRVAVGFVYRMVTFVLKVLPERTRERCIEKMYLS
ncbi:MAG: SDR family NAD(P)-dependent oxidoreductase [Lachnospiraceae bacterium]|nr:SDR family NAD(P)-dependent oxidoreductase [Lachnospiraceae bacterium]